MWDIWKEYINSVFQLMSNENVERKRKINEPDGSKAIDENSPEKMHNAQYTETVDDSPEKAHEFICRVIEISSRNGNY